MNILITGAAGFIGSTIADKLLINEDNKIFALDNFDDYYPKEIKEKNIQSAILKSNYKFFEGDITDEAFLEEIFKNNKIEKVIHLAAKAGVRPSISNPLGYVKANIEGTIKLLEVMKKYEVKKMVFASSSSVYGNMDKEPFSEDMDVSKPQSPYAATKLACEQFLYNYSQLYNIKIVALRLFTVYGPRQRPDLAINKFVRLMEKDETIPLYGDGSTKRNYTYIDDIVEGFISALNYNKTDFEIINIGGKNVVTLNEMVDELEYAMSKKAKRQYLEMQPGDVYKTVCSLDKAKRILNYEPKVTFKEGIKNFVQWYKTNKI